MDLIQKQKQDIAGNYGQFSEHYNNIKNSYFEYDEESLEELENKVYKGLIEIEKKIFINIVTPILTLGLLFLIKGAEEVSKSSGKDAEDMVSNLVK